MAVFVACGESATPVPPTNTSEPPTATPAPTEAPTEVMEEEPTAMMEDEDGDGMMMWEISDELKAYVAENAGGPGAIYIGDGNFSALVGPSVYQELMDTYGTDLGDDDGQVPLGTPSKTSSGCLNPTTTGN